MNSNLRRGIKLVLILVAINNGVNAQTAHSSPASSTSPAPQSLPSRWDELTAGDWPKALDRSNRTCILPIGILEKHGPHAPIGSDLIQVREWAARVTKKEYAVYFFQPGADSAYLSKMGRLHKSDPAGDQHAGERETSVLLYLRPELVKMDSASNESGVNQNRLSIPDIYTAIWWYADYPNHYAGDGAKATRELGQLVTEHIISSLEKALKAVKADTKTLELQKEYFDRVKGSH